MFAHNVHVGGDRLLLVAVVVLVYRALDALETQLGVAAVLDEHDDDVDEMKGNVDGGEHDEHDEVEPVLERGELRGGDGREHVAVGRADDGVPAAQADEEDEREYAVLVERGEVGDGGQLLGEGDTKVDGREDEQARGLYAELGRRVEEGEGHEAERGDEEDEHVGVVYVVARLARYVRRDGEARTVVVVPHVEYELLGYADARIQIPLLLLLEVLRVDDRLVVHARLEDHLALVTIRRDRDRQILNVCVKKQKYKFQTNCEKTYFIYRFF